MTRFFKSDVAFQAWAIRDAGNWGRLWFRLVESMTPPMEPDWMEIMISRGEIKLHSKICGEIRVAETIIDKDSRGFVLYYSGKLSFLCWEHYQKLTEATKS